MEQDSPRPASADDIVSFLPSPPEGVSPEPDSIYEIAYQATARAVATERHHARTTALRNNVVIARNNPKEWAKRWAANPENREHIEEQYEPHLTLLRNQLAIANDIALREKQALDLAHGDERAKVQHALGRHIWRHIIFPGKSKLAPKDTSLENRLRGSALTVVSPTGSGKSYMQGEALRDMGIGRPSATDPTRNRRALVCVSDQAMVNQYLGKMGDNTFRSTLGNDVSIGAFWEYDKDPDKDVTVVVTSTLTELIKTGQIKPDEYDITVVDEGHRALGKHSVETLCKLGSRLLLFTATPTYDERRGLERITDVVSEGTIRDFVERGILSPVRLLTYRPKVGNEAAAAAHLACTAIRAGRKVLVYCKPSSAAVEERDTQYISRLINEQLAADGITASAAIGRALNNPTENTRLINSFQEGNIRSLVTVGMLREGYNDPEVDTVIIIGPRLSLVDIEQKIGRCMRKGDKEALAIELIPERAHDDIRRYYSLWNVFGLEAMTQGMLIEKQDDTATFAGMNVNLSPIPNGVQLPDLGKHEKSEDIYRNTTVEDYSLPAELGGLYEEGPIRSITLSAEANTQEDVKERSVSLSAVAEQYNLPEAWLRGRLDWAKLPYTAIYEFDPLTGKRKYERWYEAETFTRYLDEHPLPKGFRVGMVSLAQMLGVTRKCLTRAAFSLDIKPQPGLTEKDGRIVAVTYAAADIRRIEAEIARIPAADDDDVSVNGLINEFIELGWPKSFPQTYIANRRHRVTPYDRRPVLATGIGLATDHISATDAERIREAYKNLGIATTTHIGIAEIARLAGVTVSSVMNHLTDDDRAGSQWLRKSKNTRPAEYLKRSQGLAVVERLEQKKLPRNLVPGPMVLARVPTSLNTLQGYIRRNKERIPTTVLNLGINKASLVSCVTWEGLKVIEEFYGLREGVQPIDYKRVARGDASYAYEVQAQHIDTKHLVPETEWTSADVACQLLGCTHAALPVLLSLVKQHEHIGVFLRDNGTNWDVRTSVLERMGRYPAKPVPPEYISHAKLQQELARRALQWPSGQRPSTTNAILARGAHDIIDVYYQPAAVSVFIKHVEAMRTRQTKANKHTT